MPRADTIGFEHVVSSVGRATAAQAQPRTVYDIGMFDGSDTQYYLECGFRVIAVEANPELVERARRRFHEAIENGRLVLVHAAIGPRSGETVELITALDDIGSSSVLPDMVAHMNPGRKFRVQTCSLPELFQQYGVPHFLKVDIEGADAECVLRLNEHNRPPYLSFEAGDDVEQLVRHAHGCGYEDFKVIDQTSFLSLQRQDQLYHRIARKLIRIIGYDEPKYRRIKGRMFTLAHSSGPAPWESDGKWISMTCLLDSWRVQKRKGMRVWYDIHCRAKPLGTEKRTGACDDTTSQAP